MQANAPQKASADRKAMLLYEDFDAVPDGETEYIEGMGDRYTTLIASQYYDPGRYINEAYTPNSGRWNGNYAFAGKNGTVILQANSPNWGAYIDTPLGDWSGDLTVTMRVRYAKSFYAADNEIGYNTTYGTSMSCAPFYNGYDNITPAQTDLPNQIPLSSGRIYGNEGWLELTFDFHNESANADGFIRFFCDCAIEIDWIKVVDNNTFMAAPAVHEATGFTEDGFTISWDPVRYSYDYFIDLWKANFTAPSGIDEIHHFEEETLPQWLKCEDYEIVELEGVDDSKALAFVANGPDAGLVTIGKDGVKLEEVTARVRFKVDDPDTPVSLICDVFGDNGWEPYAKMQYDGVFVMTGPRYIVNLDGDKFAKKYTAVRFYTQGISEDNSIYIDDLSIFAERPYKLERVFEDFSYQFNPKDDDDPYNAYTTTALSGDPQSPKYPYDTHYTFAGLDPNTQYWYRVRSHHVSDFTNSEKIHAFGVAAPELNPAANVNQTSFTARWTDAPKAQKFYVTNYCCTKAETAEEDYVYLTEKFSKCSVKTKAIDVSFLGNNQECFLDEYTDNKGWRGAYNIIGQNVIGGKQASSGFSNDYGYLISPELMVNKERGNLYIYIDAVGDPGDNLYVRFLKDGSYGSFEFDENGRFCSWIQGPATEGEKVKLYSEGKKNFVLMAFEAVQTVEAGDIIRRFDSMAEVPTGEGAYTFTNLTEDNYAYSVASSYTYNRKEKISLSDITMYVDLKTGTSTPVNGIEGVCDEEASEIARFSLDGIAVDADYKGFVIVKMTDGSVRKILVK